MIIDSAAYRSGLRRDGKLEIERACAASAEHDSFVWIGLYDPTAEELDRLRVEFDLDKEALEDAAHNHKRPRMVVHGDVLYAVFKTAKYLEADERICLGQIVIVAGPRFVISLRYGGAAGLAEVRRELEASPELLRNGPCTVVYAAVDRIVDDCVPVLGGLDTALREVEQAVFSPRTGEYAERIYRLKREVLEFQRAIAPLSDLMIHLAAGKFPGVPQSVRNYYGDVEERLARLSEEGERVSSLLTSMLEVNSAQLAMRQATLALEQTHIALRQNEDMRKISAWVAIAAVPTVGAGIYGMNFDHMPELRWDLGYPAIVVAMALVCFLLYWRLRRSGWL